MNLCIMLFPFDAPMSKGRFTPEKLIQTLIREGVRGVEPMHRGVARFPEIWERVRRAALEAGLAFPCFDINVNFVGSGSDADRESAVETVRTGVEFCRSMLGAPLALLAGTAPAADRPVGESRRRYAEGLAAAIAETRESGVRLAIEDYGVYPAFTASAEHCREILDYPGCENLGFVFDNGNFLLADERPLDVIDLFRDRIVHVHIKDFVRRSPDGRPGLTSRAGVPYRGALLGEGEAQVAEVVRTFRRNGYSGWISLEISGGAPDPLEEAVHGLRFIRAAWESGEG